MTIPSDISGLVSWYQATAVYCFSDAGGIIPCVDGDLCYVWKDRTGVLNFTQPTSGLRPTYKDNGVTRWLDFGGDRYMDCAGAWVTAEPLSLTCWAYLDVLAAMIISLGHSASDASSWRLQTSGTMSATTTSNTSSSSSAAASVAPSTGSWQHYAGTFTSAAARAAYLNGGSKGTNAVSRLTTPGTVNLGRVRARLTAANFLDGRVAELAIWNTVLTDQNIADLYASGVPTLIPSSGFKVSRPNVRLGVGL